MKVENLTKTYGGRRVLSIDNFNFEKGVIYAVLGANGSGKSTLAKLLCSLERADEMSKITDIGKVLYMPQKSYCFQMSVMKNILLGGRDEKRAKMLIERLGLTRLSASAAASLSGGESARMALARTLMSKCDMLILDEPTAAMDISSTSVSEEIIKEYARENGCCVLLITHSVKQALRVADEVIFLYEGEIAEWGEAKSVLNDPKDGRTRRFLEFYGA
ncbi:MAG: ATP-binding cassette domain-containing protein [Eubacteriaceae bacterium]|nr:ATP-binding cassette domain-containing protein [Eubacteriaceae bacterium]